MKKLKKLAVKVLSLVVAVMLVSSQNVFATGRYMDVTTNIDNETGHSNYHENDGSGGVFTVTNPVTLTIGNNAEFTGNSASEYGGAIDLDNFDATVNIGTDSYFADNVAKYGGAINIDNGTMTIGAGARFHSNKTYEETGSYTSGGGGAIYNNSNCNLTIGDYAVFDENYINAEKSSGGAINNRDSGNLTIGNYAYFEENVSENSDAGAIHNHNYGTVNIGVARFISNTAGTNGGAITNIGNFTIDDSTAQEQPLNSTVLSGPTQKIKAEPTSVGTTFVNNSAQNGGALYNYGSDAVFTMKNKFELAGFGYNSAVYGGAICNNGGTVDLDNSIIFQGNLASSNGSAIYNNAGTVNIGNNVYFYKNGIDDTGETVQYGAGAIYNTGSDSVITIGSGARFEENYSKNDGGAIYVNSGTVNIGDKAEFTNNSAVRYGGVIYNTAGTVTIGDDAKFTRNESPFGSGVIYGNGINAVFNIGNNAIFAENSNKTCGAIILSQATVNIGDNAVFEKNKSLNNFGGAIISMSGKVTIGKNATFIGNDAQNYAGAISNNGTGVITIKDGAKFIGNTANGAYSAYNCLGGAIGNYSGGTINLIANTNNVEFTGNKHGVGTEKEESNAICTQDQGTVNLWAGSASIIFNDKIKSDDNKSTLNINKKIEGYQENDGTGKVVLNADMSGYTGTVNFYSGTIEIGENGTLFGSNNGIRNIDVDNATIKMANGKVANAEFGKDGSINIRKELNLTVDADLENKAMDMVLVPLESIGSGKINVKEINIIKDSDQTTRVDFAAIGSRDSVITVNKARSVRYSYDAKLEKGEVEFDYDGTHYTGEPGYYYTFTKKGVNPVTAAGAISASVGGYATQSVVTGQAFASMDRQIATKNQPKTAAPKTSTKETAKPATKGKTEQKSSVKDSKTTTNNPKDKKDDSKKKKKAQSMGMLYASAGDQVFEETSKIERGAWLRPFILNETVKIGDTDVDNNLYGTLAGIDLPVKGDILASFYLGYAGSKQKVEEVKSNQTGYVLGATGMLIKEKWYAGLTANIIFNKASVDTDDGTNDIDMNMYSIGAKAGYNYDMGKNWILEPNITLMYGIVNCGSYETTLTKVDSQSVNNILLEPQVKARWQLTNGWQPYGLLGYAANLSSKPTVKTDAGDLDLDSIGGYVEFGAGVNKDFVNTAWSCYAQLTGRAAGRSGFEGNLGIKYKF